MRYGDYLSILLPTYNNAAYLEAAVRSILDQSYRKYELLILDDGSTDGTADVVAAFTDDRIKYIRKERTGLGDTLNKGLALARHQWIARMDADDIAVPHRLETQVRFLEEHPDTGVLSSWYAVFDTRGIRFVVRTKERHEDIAERLYLHADITHAGCIYKKDLVTENGGYVHTIAQDYELWNTLKTKTRFANVPEVLTLVRYNRESHSRTSFRKRDETMRNIQRRFYGVPSKGTDTAKPLPDWQYGWQEYFYGSKSAARRLWKGSVKWRTFRILVAYISTWLPEPLFTQFKEWRVRLRLEYLLKFPAEKKAQMQTILQHYDTK